MERNNLSGSQTSKKISNSPIYGFLCERNKERMKMRGRREEGKMEGREGGKEGGKKEESKGGREGVGWWNKPFHSHLLT